MHFELERLTLCSWLLPLEKEDITAYLHRTRKCIVDHIWHAVVQYYPKHLPRKALSLESQATNRLMSCLPMCIDQVDFLNQDVRTCKTYKRKFTFTRYHQDLQTAVDAEADVHTISLAANQLFRDNFNRLRMDSKLRYAESGLYESLHDSPDGSET